MFVVDNRTRYATDRTATTDKNGNILWIVIVKATYDIAPDGSPSLARAQNPPIMVAEYNGEDGRSSLKYETDLLPPKPSTDVLVNGVAYAPRGQPSYEFTVGLQLGRLRKVLSVRGDRYWEKTATGVYPGPTTPVCQVPLVYERAYGGYDDRDPNPAGQRIDPRNPVGSGVAARSEHLVGVAVPNFEYPNQDIAHAGPAGLGPIACSWKPRVNHAGTYDAAWAKTRKPLLPQDFDERYFQCAPADQQVTTSLPRDAQLLLYNLSPRGSQSIGIPRVHLRFMTRFTKAARQPYIHHRGELNTILVEPELDRLTMVWSSILDCGRDIDHIDATRVIEKDAIN